MADYIPVIYNLAKKLKLTKVTVSKAAIMCHQFHTRTSEDAYDMKVIAAVAVNMAIRLNNENVDKLVRINALHEVLKDTTVPELTDSSLKTFEKHVFNLETFLFKMLEGNVNHKVALEFLAPFLRSIRNWDYMEEKFSSICSHSAKLALEMYNYVECISFMPEALAAAAICISMDLFGFSRNHLDICQTFCPFLSFKMLDDITAYLQEEPIIPVLPN